MAVGRIFVVHRLDAVMVGTVVRSIEILGQEGLDGREELVRLFGMRVMPSFRHHNEPCVGKRLNPLLAAGERQGILVPVQHKGRRLDLSRERPPVMVPVLGARERKPDPAVD
jgi:hypothetical protein